MEMRAGSKPNQYVANCPFCAERLGIPDSNFHLGINLKERVYNCFRCGAKPSETGPLKDLYNYDNEEIGFLNLLFKKPKPKPKEILDLDRISTPITLVDTPEAYKYLISRHFTADEISKRDLRLGRIFYDDDYNLQTKWKNRILFPFKDKGKVTYLVGRSLDGSKPKYVNCRGSKSHVIYGLDSVTNREAILCEGIISAISASKHTGIPAIAILGKSLNKWQASKIFTKARKIYVCLDGGVDTSLVAKELLSTGIDVFKVDLPKGKDPNELHHEEFKKYFKQKKKVSYIDTFPFRFGVLSYASSS